jgi:hypothetical protein
MLQQLTSPEKSKEEFLRFLCYENFVKTNNGFVEICIL